MKIPLNKHDSVLFSFLLDSSCRIMTMKCAWWCKIQTACKQLLLQLIGKKKSSNHISKKHQEYQGFYFLCLLQGQQLRNLAGKSMHRKGSEAPGKEPSAKDVQRMYSKGWDDMGRMSVQCHLCNKVYRDASNIQDHIYALHFHIKRHHCAHCKQTFGWRTEFSAHKSSCAGCQQEKTRQNNRNCTADTWFMWTLVHEILLNIVCVSYQKQQQFTWNIFQ